MPAVYDSASGRATTAKPKRKPKVIYAPQIKATKNPSASRAATLVPGLGAVTRPTPRMSNAARTVERVKPRTPRKPTSAEQAATKARQRVRNAKAEIERKAEPARKKSEAREREKSAFTHKPVKGFLAAEQGAISNLSRLHQQDPKTYEKKLAKKGIGEGRAIAGPRGQTVEHFKGRTVGEILSERPTVKLPRAKKMTVAGFRGQTRPTHQMGVGGGKLAETMIRNAPKNLGDLTQNAPTSIVHTAKTAVTDPVRAAKETVKPFIDIAKDPTKELAERPLTTALTVTPLGRLPGLIGGKIARTHAGVRARRAGGRATDARPEAELPGTALRERQTPSRSIRKRRAQRKADVAAGRAKTTTSKVDQRVDESHDFQTQKAHQARDHAAALAKDAGLSPEHTRAVVEAAGEKAKQDAKAAFAREFGANERPSVGQTERLAAKATRETSKQELREAVDADKAARAAVGESHAADRAARSAPNPRLATLEAERIAALKQLVAGQGTHTKASVEQAKAHGAAGVSAAKSKSSPKLAELHAERKRIESEDVIVGGGGPRVPKLGEVKSKPGAKSVVVTPKPGTGKPRNLSQEARDARTAVAHADRFANRVAGNASKHVPAYIQAIAAQADKAVATLERQLARAEEEASRLEGESEGRFKSGKATRSAAASRQQDKIGLIDDALAEARLEAKRARETMGVRHQTEIGRARAAADEARERLKAIEAEARAAQRGKLADVKTRIGDEQRRISGVGPREAERVRAAITGLEDAGAGVRGQRDAVRDLSAQIAEEQARARAAAMGPSAATQNAMIARGQARKALVARQGEHSQAKQQQKAVNQQAANSTLSDAASEGRLFDHSYDAHKVADRLNEAAHAIPHGGKVPYRYAYTDTPGGERLRARKNIETPVKFKVVKVGDQHAVVPEIAAARQRLHDVVGTSPATGAMLMRDSRHALTQATLPFSLKWLGGQAVEAGLRSVVSGAGPLDAVFLKRLVERMNEIKPGAGDDLMTRISGGQFGLTGAARQAVPRGTFAERYKGHGWMVEQPAAAASALGRTPIGRMGKAGLRKYNTLVLGKLNQAIEATARNAMAGHAIKRDFLPDHVMKLTESAVDDAARGMLNTPNQIAAARAVDDMYGKYSKMSPEMRHALAYWTPFLPWYINSAHFLKNTIRDHPIKSSLMGAMASATEEWRTQQGLSGYAGENQQPDWLRGSYPFFGGRDNLSRIGALTPFGAWTDPAGALGSLALPQLLGPLGALGFGDDFTGKELIDRRGNGKPFGWPRKGLKAVVSGAEAQLPALGLGMRLSGLGPKYIDRKSEVAPWSERLAREVPGYPTGGFGGSGGGGGGGFEMPEYEMPEIEVPEIEIPEF